MCGQSDELGLLGQCRSGRVAEVPGAYDTNRCRIDRASGSNAGPRTSVDRSSRSDGVPENDGTAPLWGDNTGRRNDDRIWTRVSPFLYLSSSERYSRRTEGTTRPRNFARNTSD